MAPTGSIAIGDSDFGSFSDETDDLPRTFRREKEARARAARERAAQERAAAPTLSTDPVDCVRPQPRIYDRAGDDLRDSSSASVSATVRAFDVPFVHLMTFFLRAVLASIPALLLLGGILWVMGAGLELLFPQLVKMKILISFPN
jgi:hypothetical protein